MKKAIAGIIFVIGLLVTIPSAQASSYWDTFVINYPSFGSTLTQGEQCNVTLSGGYYGSATYSVYLTEGSLGYSGSRFLGTVNPYQSSFSFVVPTDLVGSGFKLRFSGMNGGAESGAFTINEKATNYYYTPVYNSDYLPAYVPPAPAPVSIVSTSAVACLDLGSDLGYRMKDGYADSNISSLQDYLQANGYLTVSPTGFFGVSTFQAVKDFQSAYGINPTGYAGPITRAKIRSMTCGY